jgi:hypothetical protein
MEAVPVLIDYSMYQDLIQGVYPDVKEEIIHQIKDGKLYFTTIQEIEYPMGVNEDGELLIIKGSNKVI